MRQEAVFVAILTGDRHVPLWLDHHRVPSPLPHSPRQGVDGVVRLNALPRLSHGIVPGLPGNGKAINGNGKGGMLRIKAYSNGQG